MKLTNKQNRISTFFSPLLNVLAKTRLPKLDGEIRLKGLQKPVQVVRDVWGVPHIYAEISSDLFYAQGFVHAQDRLWQMEFSRRVVAGRLAELLGEIALPLDRWMRTLTLRRVAEFEVNLQAPEDHKYLQAYANGVNAYLDKGPLPIEFFLLQHRPEPWVVADSLSWIKMMAWSLSVNWESEILRSHLVARLGPELAAELEPPQLPCWPYAIPPGAEYQRVGLNALERADAARPFSSPTPYAGLGSNNWAIAGTRSLTGKPLLANDMHLGLTAPSIWYENHLISNDLSVTGVTFPGLPGVVSGHNGHVAWGFTNGFQDVQDVYLEHLKKLPDGTIQAEYNGQWEEIKVLHEQIRIKDQKPVTEEVLITRHGPIINALSPNFCGDQPLALRWTALEPDTMISGLFSFIQAKDCKQLHETLRFWTSPAQNVVYADVDGNISYTFAGKVPIRSKNRGRLPVPGWTDEYEWTGYLPFDTLPHIENPAQGFIVTANNQVVSDDYPVQLDLEPIAGDRAQRISEMIMDNSLRDGQEKIDIPFIERMQFDQVSCSAKEFIRRFSQLSLLNSAHHPETELHSALNYLKNWDGKLAAESIPAAIYQVFIRKFIWLVLSDKLAPDSEYRTARQGFSLTNPSSDSSLDDLPERVMGKGPTPILAESSLFGSHWLPWLVNQMENPDSKWFNLGKGEKRDDVMLLALRMSVEDLKSILGESIPEWSWGKLHQLTYQHVLGSNNFLGPLLNLGPYPVGGDQTTIWATSTFSHNLGTDQMVGPPFRMIIDLKNLENSVSILAPGQSGNPASPHYQDQVEAWFKGYYHPILYYQPEIEKQAKHRLKLLPR